MLLPREKIKLIFLNKIKYICQPVNISKLNELKCVSFMLLKVKINSIYLAGNILTNFFNGGNFVFCHIGVCDYL